MPIELYCPNCGEQFDKEALKESSDVEQAICPTCGEREAIKAFINFKRIHQQAHDGVITNTIKE